MPTYDYLCTSCRHSFEHFQAMSDPPLETCPQCGEPVRRLMGGGSGIIFKGSGFYVTDNRKKSEKPAETKEKTETKEKSTTD